MLKSPKGFEAVLYAAARRKGDSEVEAEDLVRRHRESEAQKSAKAKAAWAIVVEQQAAEAAAFRGELDRVTAEREQREQQAQRATEPRDLTHYDQVTESPT
jgi:hypothetical protein